MPKEAVDSLVAMLARSVERYAHRPLFGARTDAGWTWMSYADFGRHVDALRSGLANLGVVKGDRVAIISRNRIEWAAGCYASAGLGAAWVPMYESQLDSDWKHIVTDSGAVVCLVSGAVAPRAMPALRTISGLKHVVDLDAPKGDRAGYLGLIAAGEARPGTAILPDASDLAAIVYTSGTTGRPKGVRLSHGSIVSNVAGVIQVVPFCEDDRSLSFLPWAHVFGADELHGILLIGASTGICDGVASIARDLLEVRPTILFAVPRIWNGLYQSVRRSLSEQPAVARRLFDRGTRALHRRKGGKKLSLRESLELRLAERLVLARIRERLGGRVRMAVSSAAALSPDVAQFIDDLGITVLEAYGLTETSACATINRPDDRCIGSVGKPIPGVRVLLDHDVPGGDADVGEIVIYGHGVMMGYHNLPEATAQAMTADGGLRTGDLGRLDGAGFLHVAGRLKEIYKLENGKYVAPAAIEEQLTLSPYIDQAFVYGVNRPHNVALVVPNEQAVRSWAREHGVHVTAEAHLASDPLVRPILEAELDALSREVRGYERVESFAVIEEPFSTDNGLLTPTLKVRRGEVIKKYLPLLDSLYRPS